jgi:uncharacterized protein (DUF1501 family)
MADTMLAQNGSNAVFTAISTSGNAVFLSGDAVIQYQLTTASQPAIRISAASASTLNGSSTAAARLRDILRDAGPTHYFAQDYNAVVRRSMDAADAVNTAFATPTALGIPAPPAYVNPVTGSAETNSLATQLQTVVRAVSAAPSLGITRQVFFVSLGGFDTHDIQNQVHPNLLAKIAHGMAYLDAALGNIAGLNMRGNVTAFTMSDFNRTFTTNGDGTDHAWGGHQFVMGGAVKGRDMYGQFPTVGVDQSGFVNPDMSGNTLVPTTSVHQFAATLGRWFGLGDAQLLTVLPYLANFSRRDLGFMV